MRTLESFLKESKESLPIGGFVISDLVMKGFMRYIKEAKINFPQGLTAIIGRTGSGKTTILDAITFALYKSTSRTDLPTVRIEDICAKGGWVKLRFRQDSHTYEVTRGLTPKGKSYLTLKMDGKELPGSIKEIEEKIREIIGLDYVGFKNSTFIRQEEMKQLGSESSATRLEIFQKLFRLENFAKAQEIASERLRKTELEMRGVEAKLETKREQLAGIPEKQEILNERKRAIGREKEKLAALEESMSAKEAEGKELEKKHEEFLMISAEMNQVKRLIADLEMKIKRSEAKEKETTALKWEIDLLEKETANYESLREKIETLLRMEQKSTILEKEKKIRESERRRINEDFEKAIHQLIEKHDRQENRLKTLSTEIDKDQAFDFLRTEGKLGERIDRIGKEVTWPLSKELIDELFEERKVAINKLTEIKEKVSKIDVDSFIRSEIESRLQAIKKDKKLKELEYRERKAEIEEKVNDLIDKIGKLGFGDEQRERLGKFKKEFAEKKGKLERLSIKRKELDEMGDVSKLLEDLASAKEKNQNALNELSIKLDNFRSFEKKYEQVRKEIKEFESKILRKREIISGMEGEARRLNQELLELEQIKEEVKSMEIKDRELRENAEVYSILRDRVFHKKGIVMHAINRLLPVLSVETSTELADLTDGRFSGVEIKPIAYEGGKRYGISIDVLGVDGSWHDVQEFSGGERTQINAALRFSIAKELASLPRIGKTYGRMRTLFIDEGDLGSLDTEVSRELFVKKLFDMQRFFDKIILITHLTEVADKFPNKIKISMTSTGESMAS